MTVQPTAASERQSSRPTNPFAPVSTQVRLSDRMAGVRGHACHILFRTGQPGSLPTDTVGIRHDGECNGRCGDARENGGVDRVSALPTGWSTEKVCLKPRRIFAHWKAAPGVKAPARFRDLEHRE